MLVVCPGAPGGFGYWRRQQKATERHGAKWAGIEASQCNKEDMVDGNVYVAELPVEGYPDEAGVTFSSVNPYTGIARAALVAIKPEAINTQAAVHELLHAQGLDHHTMTNHVLNRAADRGGWRWDGVRRALREAWGDR